MSTGEILQLENKPFIESQTHDVYFFQDIIPVDDTREMNGINNDEIGADWNKKDWNIAGNSLINNEGSSELMDGIISNSEDADDTVQLNDNQKSISAWLGLAIDSNRKESLSVSLGNIIAIAASQADIIPQINNEEIMITETAIHFDSNEDCITSDEPHDYNNEEEIRNFGSRNAFGVIHTYENQLNVRTNIISLKFKKKIILRTLALIIKMTLK